MLRKFNLKALMEIVKNGQFVGIDISTVPTIRKTIDVADATGKTVRQPNPYFGHITKVVTGSRCFVGASYENMVKRRLAEEGKTPEEIKNFEVGKLPWGSYVDGGFPVIEHNGKFYLRVIFHSSGTTSYFNDGKLINKDEILGMTEKASSGGQGGLENQVIIRTICFDNIIRIRAAGQELKGPFDWR